MSLSDGPMNLDEIRENFFAFARRMGIFAPLYQQAPADYDNFILELKQDLDRMVGLGWVASIGEKYSLTEVGQQKAGEHLAEVRKAANLLQNLLQPATVSKVSMVAHFALAALKLPAAILSGSIGLFNDAADTLLDGLSSLMVYFGIRFNKERTVNIFLVVMMLIIGVFGFIEAVRRLFTPVEPSLDWFTFLSAIISALVCLGLGFYQRYVGLKAGSLVLIIQSVDSRNHVIAAAGVISGLIAFLFSITLLDTLVGLCIAVIILKSGVELAVELIHSRGGETTDISQYRMGWSKWYDDFKQAQLRDWMLYLAYTHRAKTRLELIEQASQALDFTQYPALRAFGLGNHEQSQEMVSRSIQELIERGWLEALEPLKVTETGWEHLQSQVRKVDRKMGRSFFRR